jgi:methyl-accepting chemotaxis protein WspA
MYLQKMTIQTKLFSLLALSGLAMLAGGAVSLLGMFNLSRELTNMAETELPLTQVLAEMTESQLAQGVNLERAFRFNQLYGKNPAAKQTFLTASSTFNRRGELVEEALNKAEEIAKRKSKIITAPAEVAELEAFQNNLNKYRQLHSNYNAEAQTAFSLVRRNQPTEAEFIAERLQPKREELKGELRKLLDQVEALSLKSVNQANEHKRTIAIAAIMTFILALVIILSLGFFITRQIVQSLGRAVGVAQKVSVGDLTTRMEVDNSHDEIGQLLNALKTMTKNLESLIRNIQKSGVQVTTSTTEIAASGKQLEATVNEQVASTNEVVATAREIAATSNQLVKTMDEVTQMAETTTMSASQGQKELNRMSSTMQQLGNATGSISGKLGIISEKANNINSIVTTITKVADQTNLLSLNAAIEAEKAGEYGMGFAVVAREIRRLADQTAIATLDIESMVKEMQSAVSTGVMEMDKFTKEVNQGVQDIGIIGVQLTSIIEQVQSLTPRFEVVDRGMESQAEGAQQISETMAQLSEASTQTAEALREINGAIAQLNEAAQGLHQEISQFKVAS